MTAVATASDLERFRSAIGRQIGLRFDHNRLGFLGEVLQRRLKDRRADGDAYLWSLENEPAADELTALAKELTVGETYFFRNNEQFRAFAEIVLPDRLRSRKQLRVLRLLSAGCSSGEEAYSLAIVAKETIQDPSCKISIRAVDLNPTALEKAARARYSTWALRETPIDTRAKWFCPDGRDVVLDESIRAMVAFEQGNLASDNPGLWQPSSYDAIFCRNVLMYFEPEQMRAAIARIARSLAPGGYLFLGHAETLRGVSDRLHLRNSHQTFYHQLKDGSEADSDCVIPFTPRPSPARTPPRPDQDAARFDEIRLASERVAALVPMSQPSAQAAVMAAPFNSTRMLELLRQERFAEALGHVQAAQGATKQTPDLLLLEAMLLAQCGKLDAADETASRLLLLDGGNAGAHYILALCREHVGLGEQASEHHRAAAGHDSSFAMPRLHLGLLARRAGDLQAARGEFSLAMALLEREDAARLQLFGGGFNREALTALCQSALKECGGRA
ncbi:MAG: CheR family methyltransferase [Pseudolabrys sp.]